MVESVIGRWVFVGVLVTYLSTLPYVLLPDEGCDSKLNVSSVQGCNDTKQIVSTDERCNGTSLEALSDQETDTSKRNIDWYVWFWDNWYICISVCMLCSNLLENVASFCCIPNWGCKYRSMLYIPIILIVFTVNLGMKLVIVKEKWHESIWVWCLMRSCVCISCVLGYAWAVTFVAMHTEDVNGAVFLYVRLGKAFVALLVALGCFYFNQLYVYLYQLGQKHVLDSQYADYCWVYDIFAVLVFTDAACKFWTDLAFQVVGSVSRYQPSSDEARLTVILLVWMETFKIAFSRVIFSDVDAWWLMALIILKETLGNVARFVINYPSTKIIEKIKQIEDTEKAKTGIAMRVLRAMKSFCLTIILSYEGGSESVAKHLPGFKEQKEHYIAPTPTAPVFFEGSASSSDVIDEPATYKLIENADEPKPHFLDVRFMLKYKQHILAADGQTASADAMERVFTSRIRRSMQAPESDYRHGPSENQSDEELAILSMNSSPRDKDAMSKDSARRERCCDFPSRGYRECSVPDHFLSTFSTGFPWSGLTVVRKDSREVEWKESEDLSGRELLKQVSWVQRRFRLEFCGIFWAHLTSSIVGLTFLLTYKYFPCTVLAYGLEPEPSWNDSVQWYESAILDIVSFLFVKWFHWSRRLEDDEESWEFVNIVLDNKFLMLACWASCAHVVTDVYLAMYRVTF